MAIDTLRDPVLIQWWTDSSGNKITLLRSNEQHKVVNGKILLTEIPSEFDRVQITGYTELRYGQLPSSANEFVVNYTLGEISFYSTEEAKTITIARYYSRGIVYYPSSRIYNDVDSNGNITQTLGDVLSFAKITYLIPVATFANISTTYPNPSFGNSVQCEDTGKFYRWNGTSWQYFQILTPTQLANVLTDMVEMTDNFNLMNDIKGTHQEVTMNPDQTIQKIQHKDSTETIIREDIYTYEGNIITEVRTIISTRTTLTYIYNMDTFETQVI